MGAVIPLKAVLLAHPKAYRQHVQNTVTSGNPSAFGLVERYWVVAYRRLRSMNFVSPIGEVAPFTQLCKSMEDRCNRFMDQIGDFTELSDIPVEVDRVGSKTERRVKKTQMAAMFAITDACDHCGKSVDETKLMRCSKCLCTRYSGRDCQMTAWKNSRSYGLKQNTS